MIKRRQGERGRKYSPWSIRIIDAVKIKKRTFVNNGPL